MVWFGGNEGGGAMVVCGTGDVRRLRVGMDGSVREARMGGRGRDEQTM